MGATKLSAKQKTELAKLAGLKLKGTTVEEVKPLLIDYLAKNEIEGIDDDEFDSILDMAVVIFEGSDEETDAAAEEVQKDKKTKNKKTEVAAEKEEEEEAEVEQEEEEEKEATMDEMVDALVNSGRKKKEVVGLKLKELKKEYAKLVAATPEEPKKEAKSKKKEEPVAKDKPKADKPKAEKTEKKVSKKIDPLNSEEDAAKFADFKKELLKIFKGHNVQFNHIANGGLSVRIVGENSNKVVLSYDTPKYDKDGEIIASVFIPIKDRELFEELVGEDVEVKSAWNGALHATNQTFAEVLKAFKDNPETVQKIITSIVKKDEKLGKNREKMEQDLKNDKSKKIDDIKSKNKKKEEPVAEEPKKKKEKDAPAPEEPKKDKKDKKEDKKKKK